MFQLAVQQKIFEFLNEEFSKIKAQSLLKYLNQKFKFIVIEKSKKLQQNIELIVNTDFLDLKLTDLKTKIILL